MKRQAGMCRRLLSLYDAGNSGTSYRRRTCGISKGKEYKERFGCKNQSITDYRRATGFEALVGYLYLKKEYKRLVELVTIGLESMEKELENGEKND